MVKIAVAHGDLMICEKVIARERVTIGRGAHNDVVINDPMISNEHAVITVSANGDSLLEDLDSTNGTKVNGQPVRKHFLLSNDAIELAHYSLQYELHEKYGHAGEEMDGHTFNRGCLGRARIRVLNGANAGKEILFDKPLITVGKENVQTAIISKLPVGYFITHVTGESCPHINGEMIGFREHPVLHTDVIDVAGVKMHFLLN